MNKVTKAFSSYIWIIDTIRRKQPITFEQIGALWLHTSFSDGAPLDRKTFRRALDCIEEIFDIEITCGRGKLSTYTINDRSLRGNSLQRWMLSTLSVTGAVRDARQMQDRILLENVPSGDHLLTEVTRAMQNGHTLRIRYQKFVDSQPYEAELEPYCLKLFRQRWYLLAHRTDRTYLAIYALDRMLAAEEMDVAFRLPDDFAPEVYFRDMFGVFQPTEKQSATRIVLRAYDGEWNYLRTLPLHGSQEEQGRGTTPAGEPYVDFVYHLCPTLDFELELLSRISSIEVLEPLSLRRDVCEMARRGVGRNSCC